MTPMGLIGLMGLMGLIGLMGPMGLMGLIGPMGWAYWPLIIKKGGSGDGIFSRPRSLLFKSDQLLIVICHQ